MDFISIHCFNKSLTRINKHLTAKVFLNDVSLWLNSKTRNPMKKLFLLLSLVAFVFVSVSSISTVTANNSVVKVSNLQDPPQKAADTKTDAKECKDDQKAKCCSKTEAKSKCCSKTEAKSDSKCSKSCSKSCETSKKCSDTKAPEKK